MSALSLVELGAPVTAGDRVFLPSSVWTPAGRRIPRRAAGYEVLGVLPDRAVVVRVRPDCSALPARFETGPAGDPCRMLLFPGEYTSYGEGRGPATIEDE